MLFIYNCMLIYSSLQINLPESVTNRFAHSITTYQISKDSFQVIVIGGIREYSLVSGCDMTVIVELGMIMLCIVIRD